MSAVRGRPHALSQAEEWEVCKKFDKGMSIAFIAMKFYVDRSTVYKILRDNGIEYKKVN